MAKRPRPPSAPTRGTASQTWCAGLGDARAGRAAVAGAGWRASQSFARPLLPALLRGELRPDAETTAGGTHLQQPLGGRAGPPTVQFGHRPCGLRGRGSAPGGATRRGVAL